MVQKACKRVKLGNKFLFIDFHFIWLLKGGDTLAAIHAWIAARSECEQSGMLPVADTLAVIAALIHAASYPLNSKLLQKFIPINLAFHLPETCMSLSKLGSI